MLTRKTQYGWMALGGLLCLFGVVLTCKLTEGNCALARDGAPPAAENKSAEPIPPPPAKDSGEEKAAETKKAEDAPKPPQTPSPTGVTMPMPEAAPAPTSTP